MKEKTFAVIVCLTLALVVVISPGNSCPCPNDDLVGDETISDETIVAPPPPSQGTETPPEKSCPNQEFHDPMTELVEQEVMSTSRLTDALMLAIITAKKGERRTRWEIVFALVFPSAILWLIFCEIPLRNMHQRFPSPLLKQILINLFVNGVFGLLLPSKFQWVPTLCFVFSFLTLTIVRLM